MTGRKELHKTHTAIRKGRKFECVSYMVGKEKDGIFTLLEWVGIGNGVSTLMDWLEGHLCKCRDVL